MAVNLSERSGDDNQKKILSQLQQTVEHLTEVVTQLKISNAYKAEMIGETIIEEDLDL